MIYYVLVFLAVAVICFFLFKSVQSNKLLIEENNKLLKLNEELEERAVLKQKFISNLSAELRTPLYGIIGLTNLLVEDIPDLKDNQNVKSLKFSSDYLLTLITNVLQINKVLGEELVAKNTPFCLKTTTQDLVHSFRYATENSDNTLHFEYDDEINDVLIGDSTILIQVLINLINNALRFTSNGNVRFKVSLDSKGPDSNTVTFYIWHDGHGISMKDQKSIYHEFASNERSKESYLGIGLNSSIIERLIKALNGKMQLNKDVNDGTESTFTLDFKVGTELMKEPLSKKMKALVVDDNKISLIVTDKFLSQENFECTTADNGTDAVKLVKENAYDIVLMDVNMPGLNGVGATKKIREFNTDVPIIAFTAVDVTQLNEQMMRAGLNDYILKPFDKNILLEKINKYVKISTN